MGALRSHEWHDGSPELDRLAQTACAGSVYGFGAIASKVKKKLRRRDSGEGWEGGCMPGWAGWSRRDGGGSVGSALLAGFGSAAVVVALAMGARVIAMARNVVELGKIKQLDSKRITTIPIMGDVEDEVACRR